MMQLATTIWRDHMLNIGDASGNAAGDYFGIAIGDDGSGYNKELYTSLPKPVLI